jgi:hypothetical protein
MDLLGIGVKLRKLRKIGHCFSSARHSVRVHIDITSILETRIIRFSHETAVRKTCKENLSNAS